VHGLAEAGELELEVAEVAEDEYEVEQGGVDIDFGADIVVLEEVGSFETDKAELVGIAVEQEYIARFAAARRVLDSTVSATWA